MIEMLRSNPNRVMTGLALVAVILFGIGTFMHVGFLRGFGVALGIAASSFFIDSLFRQRNTK